MENHPAYDLYLELMSRLSVYPVPILSLLRDLRCSRRRLMGVLRHQKNAGWPILVTGENGSQKVCFERPLHPSRVRELEAYLEAMARPVYAPWTHRLQHYLEIVRGQFAGDAKSPGTDRPTADGTGGNQSTNRG